MWLFKDMRGTKAREREGILHGISEKGAGGRERRIDSVACGGEEAKGTPT